MNRQKLPGVDLVVSIAPSLTKAIMIRSLQPQGFVRLGIEVVYEARENRSATQRPDPTPGLTRVTA